MQKILEWKGSVSEYKAGFKKLELEKPGKCGCGCVKYHKWGKYERYVIEEKAEYIIAVQRICCVKCGKTISYLPSFCVSKKSYSVNLIMAILSALILKNRVELGDRRRYAYVILRRFVGLEKLWLTFLRSKGFGDIPRVRKERGVKIFTSLLKLHETKNITSSFFGETGRHFMCEK